MDVNQGNQDSNRVDQTKLDSYSVDPRNPNSDRANQKIKIQTVCIKNLVSDRVDQRKPFLDRVGRNYPVSPKLDQINPDSNCLD